MSPTKPANVIELRPTKHVRSGRPAIAGIWISISIVKGCINIPLTLQADCDWIKAGNRIVVDYYPDNNSLKILPADDGYLISARKVAGEVKGYFTHIAALTGVDFPENTFNGKDGKFGRFSVKVLKKSIACDLNQNMEG